MKKYLLLLLMITIGASSVANPIVPMAKISEIYTDSANTTTETIYYWKKYNFMPAQNLIFDFTLVE